jgi:hypothetical protein
MALKISGNTIVSYGAGGITTNIQLGRSGLTSNTTGANNTSIGYSAGTAITTGSNLTVIGASAAASSATATNEITLGNSSVTRLRLPGLSKNVGALTAVATATAITVDSNVTDRYFITALATALTINTPTGTPYDGQTLIYRIKDNGSSRALTWANGHVTIGGSILPVVTIVNKVTYVMCIYNSAAAVWQVLGVVQE